jgi:hypothetical protein
VAAAHNFCALKSIFVRENIPQTEIQPAQQRFQSIQREMLHPVFDPKNRLVRQTGLLGEVGVGQFAALFPHELGQLLVKIASHRQTMANNP